MPKKTNFEVNGSKYYRVTATIGYDGEGRQKQIQFYGTSKKEAKAKRDEYLGNLKSGLDTNYKEMSIEKLMKIWLFDVVKIESSYSTFDRYEGVYRNYIIGSPLAGMKVYEVKRLFLQGYYNQMANNGCSASKIFNFNKLLKTFFNYAVAENYILKNPCYGIKFHKNVDRAEDTTEVDPFTDEEIEKIVNTAKGTMKTLFQFDLATGLRRGEVLGLRVKDVDLENMSIQVNQALKKVKRFINENEYEYVTIVEVPKTQTSIRMVPLPSKLRPILKQYVLYEKEKHLKFGIPYDEECFFFTSEVCTPFDGKNISTAFARLLKRAEVRYRCFHNIRHTYATKLFEARVPLITISKLLGHTNTNITANTYISIMPKEKINAAEELNYLFTEI